MVRLKLISKDGLSYIYNVETGEQITNCVKAVFTHTANEGTKLEVTMVDWSPILEIECEGSKDLLDITTISDRVRKYKPVKFREFT